MCMSGVISHLSAFFCAPQPAGFEEKLSCHLKKRTAHSSTVSLTEFLKFAFWTLLWCLVFLELSLHLPFEAHKSRPAIEAGFDSNWVFIKTLKCIEIKWACVTALSKNEQMVLMNRLNHAPLGLLCRCCINLATFLNSYGTRSPRLAFVQALSPHFASIKVSPSFFPAISSFCPFQVLYHMLSWVPVLKSLVAITRTFSRRLVRKWLLCNCGSTWLP